MRLPISYLNVLAAANGGHPERGTFLSSDDPNSSWSIDSFYFLSEDKRSAENLWGLVNTWRPILGDACLPFAADGGGNPFFMDLSQAGFPVSVCIHDERFRILRLAGTFEEFIDALQDHPDFI